MTSQLISTTRGLLAACMVACAGLACQPAAHAGDAPALAHDADLYLVPIGPVPAAVLQRLAERYRGLTRLKVETTAELPLPDWTIDVGRRQLVAERAHDLMQRVFEPWKWKAWSVVIGVSAHDMYIAGTNWRFAYAYGAGRYALVSASNMADAQSTPGHWSPRVIDRLTKMVDKRLAVQYFGYGAALPAPEALTAPILSLADLDRLDATQLDQALALAASRVPTASPEPAPEPRPSEAAMPMPVWLLAALIGLGLSALIGLAVLGHGRLRASGQPLRRLAEQRGWRYGEVPTRWYQPARCFIEGVADGTPFRLDWYHVGSGKSARRHTRWLCETGTDLELSVVPSPGLWGRLRARQRARTGDAHYDCRFLAQTGRDRLLTLPAALRAGHLEMPASVYLREGLLELVHPGHAGPEETERLVNLALAWLAFARGQGSAAGAREASTRDSGWEVLGCVLGHGVAPVFWLMLGATLLILFGIASEEGNVAWEIAWQRVMPFALLAWLVWLAWRWRTRFHPGGRIAETVLSVLLLGFFWLMSGAGVLAWNALVGEQREVLVVGPVTDKRTWHDKQGTHYALTLSDVEEQRPVEVNTDQATYERVRLGDPVGFRLTRGSLGIYYRARWR
jgi:predicted Zn-dependent protease